MTGSTGAAPASIFDEMRRQGGDARESFARNAAVAERIAASARRSGRLVLLGMGGSHAVNRVAEVGYRAAGLDATAMTASEALLAPLPLRDATVLLVSQSGESGEIVALLERAGGGDERFGLTLNPDGALAKVAPSLIGHGGVEEAFAATRSLYVSLALHARVFHALGLPHDRIIETATRQPALPVEAAVGRLAGVDAVTFTGRAETQGIAEAGALGLQELGRLPAFALEGGHLRHGPVEALGPRLGIVFIRQATNVPDSTAALARICVEGGSPTVVFDLSGEAAVAGAETVAFPPSSGMEAALTVLPTLQAFIIETARRRVGAIGEPVRATKVTRET